MPLTSLPAVLAIPQVGIQSAPWLQQLINAADAAIKSWCKRDFDLTTYPGAAINGQGDSGIYSGNGLPDLVLRQYPVQVGAITVYFNPTGAWGQSNTALTGGQALVQGTDFALQVDRSIGGNAVSQRGLLTRICGGDFGYGGFWGTGPTWDTGKLAASRQPYWPRGYGNLYVTYTAGYQTIPPDLQYAANMLVAYMVRNQPSGSPLSSESLGAYSYALLQQAANGMIPQLGTVVQTLVAYRETGW